MDFFDCNLSYGATLQDRMGSCSNLNDLTGHMSRAGIAGGLVVNTVRKEAAEANEMLAEDLKNQNGSLKGVWYLLPSCTGEIPPPRDLPLIMKKNNIAALTLNTENSRFLPRKSAIGDYLEMAEERGIPVLLSTSRGLTLEQIDDIMRDFPKLTAVLTYMNAWPNDRLIRPFLTYENMYLDMTFVLTDSWLKDILKYFSAERILFGSGFPLSYMGAHMMVIKHAEIDDKSKNLIAGGNFLRLMEEACYD